MTSHINSVLPTQTAQKHAQDSLLSILPLNGIGDQATQNHLLDDIVPALNQSSQSANYYGFVTGGATPIAAFADNLVTKYDQNVQVHLPLESAATVVEDATLRMLCELVDLAPEDWAHRTFTTGATASNVIGLTCGREYAVAEAARRLQPSRHASVAEDGLFEALKAARIERVQILATVPHSSLRKAAAIIGLGRACFVDVSRTESPHRFDLSALENALQRGPASIIAISCAEINTGFFATSGIDMRAIRQLADTYGAWIHVDAAFGLLARLLPQNSTYDALLAGVANIDLADSITGDAHKLLNVPYDCGFLLSKHLALAHHCFQNPSAAYLSTTTSEANLPSPLNIGIENSRRFRALPVYASLASHGRAGYTDMLERQIRLARAIAALIDRLPAYNLLPVDDAMQLQDRLGRVYIIVLFCARDAVLNAELVRRINGSGRIYVSGTQWEGQPAARFAVANWQVDVKRDLEVVKSVLEEVATGGASPDR